MITPEEWDNLKIGDKIYFVLSMSTAVDIREIFDIKVKNKKTIQISKDACFIDYNCCKYDNFFINKGDALNHLITNLSASVNQITLAIEDAKKQLEQEHGK